MQAVSTARTVRMSSSWQRSADELHAGLYAGANGKLALSMLGRGRWRYDQATLPDNICRSQVDTLTAKIAKQRPLPQVVTSHGDWKAQRKGKKLSQLIDGVQTKVRFFEQKAKRQVRDALVFGRAFFKVVPSGRQILGERMFPWEVHFDTRDAQHGEPRNAYHVTTVDKGVLIERFARTESGGLRRKLVEAIENAVSASPMDERDQVYDVDVTTDRVQVVEAWHLCDSDEHDEDPEHHCTGRHVVAVQGMALVDEVWTWPTFPFAALVYQEPLAGIHGAGLVEQLEGFQFEIDETNRRVSEMYAMSGSLVVVPDGGGVVESELVNGVGTVLHTSPNPAMQPSVFKMDLVHPGHGARIAELVNRGFQATGVSSMSAASTKPAGVTAAVALQALDDVETERFILFGRQYEAFCLDVARLITRCVRDIADEYGDVSIPVQLKSGVLSLSWKDIAIDDFDLKVFPTSMLPQQPGARLQVLQDLMNAGLIDRTMFFRLLDSPDLAAAMELETSGEELVDEILQRFLDVDDEESAEGQYIPPDPYLDLEYCKKRAHQHLSRARLDGAPEYVLELLRRFALDAIELQARANPPPPPPGPPPMPGPPPGPPMPPPDMPPPGLPGPPPPV